MPRVSHIIPANTPPTGGNLTSAERVRRELQELGWSGIVLREGEEVPANGYIVAWNAATVAACLIANGLDKKRLLVVWTGTDLWEELPNDPHLSEQLAGVRVHVVFTEDARERLLQYGVGSRDSLHVIPPGVEDHFFNPYAALPSETPIILVAGGARPVKRTHWAIDLVDRLRLQHPDVKLWIAGPMRDDGEAERIAKRLTGRPWVTLLGDVPRADMPELYCRATVLLNTSRSEGVSNALMEAMACGVPIVATRIPGNEALIADRETGWLFESEGEFIQATDVVLRENRVRDQVRIRARQQVQREHGSRQEMAAYQQLISQLDRGAI